MLESKLSSADLEQFRSHLVVFAHLNWNRRLMGLHDPEDFVQVAFAEAHQKWSQFRGASEGELARWLMSILRNRMLDEVRRLGRLKNDEDKMASLEAAMDASSVMVQQWFGTEPSTPSERAMRNERIEQLYEALTELNSAQRHAVILHHLNGSSLAEIAEAMERTEVAVAGLLRRGLGVLRRLLTERE